jgi:hypothetical protein
MESHVPAVVEMLVEEAVEMRNMAAAKLILERVFPADVVKLEDQMTMLKELQDRIDSLESAQ